MADIFLKIVNMSISACWIILAVILFRFIFNNVPKWINCVLWGIAGLRLVMPFSFESIFSLVPSTETITKLPDSPRPQIDSGISVIDNQVNGYLQGSYFEGVTRPMGNFTDITTIFTIIWIIGISALIVYTLTSYLRLKNKISTAVILRDNIYQSEAVVSPFILGIIRPKIYLPFSLNEQEISSVIAHEKAHLQRKDYLWKPLGFLIMTLHWFNPVVWLGYILLCRDIELACDEKAIKDLNNVERADYSQALLTCCVNRRMIAACPLAFGEVGVKDRIKSILGYKKPAFWIILVSVVTSIIVALCFLTNPVSNKLLNIEGHKLNEILNTNAVITVSDGNNQEYIGAVSEDILQKLFNIRISDKELSTNRDENRDKSKTIYLNIPVESEEITTHFSETICVHFNSDFSEVWVNDNVKPTLSYRVKDSGKAKKLYETIANYPPSDKSNINNDDASDSTYNNIIDSIIFDIDDDGIYEQCVLSYGPTSGLYTVVFTATELNKNEADYINTFNFQYTGGTEFYKSSDNKLQIKCKNIIYDAGKIVNEDDVFLDIQIEDNNIVLLEGCIAVPYWGAQGITPDAFLKKINLLTDTINKAIYNKKYGKYVLNKSKLDKYNKAVGMAESEILHISKNDEYKITTVYAYTLYEEFCIYNESVVSLASSAEPVEFKFSLNSNNEYELKHYRVLDKKESISAYLPGDKIKMDDSEIMEGLRQNLKLKINNYYGYLNGEENGIHENQNTPLTAIEVDHQEMFDMFTELRVFNPEHLNFSHNIGLKRRCFDGKSFYYYCIYENQYDKIFVFWQGHYPQPIHILDYNSTFITDNNYPDKDDDKFFKLIADIDK